jgi:hypothetical protein
VADLRRKWSTIPKAGCSLACVCAIDSNEQSGLQTRIATESVSLCVRMKRKFARLHGSEPVRVKPGNINSPAIPNRFVSGKI